MSQKFLLHYNVKNRNAIALVVNETIYPEWLQDELELVLQATRLYKTTFKHQILVLVFVVYSQYSGFGCIKNLFLGRPLNLSPGFFSPSVVLRLTKISLDGQRDIVFCEGQQHYCQRQRQSPKLDPSTLVPHGYCSVKAKNSVRGLLFLL